MKDVTKVIITILSITIVVFIVAVNFHVPSTTSTSTNNYNEDETITKQYYHTVEYRVTGTSTYTASITMENQDHGTSQYSEVSLPWTYTLHNMISGDFVYISAQNQEKYGCITTEIYLDGILVKQSESCGAYVIATSSGRL